MARPGWYSDHPSACTCVGCSERDAVGTRTADRRGGEQPPTGVGTSLGNGGGYGRGGGTGGGNAWKWLAAIVVGVILIAVVYQAGSWPESGQPTPANVVPASTTASEATPPIRTAPSPIPDVRATTEAAVAATVEALRPTSTTEAVPLALATTPTSVPETRPTIPTPAPTKAPAAIPSPAPTATSFPAPTLPVSLRDFRNGRWLEQEDPRLASSINRLSWMQDGIDGTESDAIQSMLYIAVTSRSVVSSLLSLGWVRDGISAD